ncbi:hypothetical protein [Thalassotalea hakodatensis]|uniref:hypothetical protein n=1 Tax=Thalassotalea hakodatensis TaxID=3030492 RepID=UPI00257391F3|nr:hypothetical protein [Thalassotalea hakodatensis]
MLSIIHTIRVAIGEGIWKSLAFIIVLLLAGPELIIGMELMALIEVVGASTFVIAYLTGLKLLMIKIKKRYLTFEKYSVLFLPTWQYFKAMPSLCLHAIPHRTVIISLFATVYLGMLFILI